MPLFCPYTIAAFPAFGKCRETGRSLIAGVSTMRAVFSFAPFRKSGETTRSYEEQGTSI
jgi:hypothetical protein